MRIIASYMMAVLGGNSSPDVATITKILDSVGITADTAEIEKVIAKLDGKNLDELIKAGDAQLMNVPGGGGGGGGGEAAAGGDAPAAAAVVEEEEEEEAAPAIDMFGGDDDEEGDY